MDINTYQRKAHSTAIYPTDITMRWNDRKGESELSWIYPALGLAGESGEILNKLKKIIRDQDGILENPIGKSTLAFELGDLLWYTAELCTSLGLTLEEVAVMNLAKLEARAKKNTIHGSGEDR